MIKQLTFMRSERLRNSKLGTRRSFRSCHWPADWSICHVSNLVRDRLWKQWICMIHLWKFMKGWCSRISEEYSFSKMANITITYN